MKTPNLNFEWEHCKLGSMMVMDSSTSSLVLLDLILYVPSAIFQLCTDGSSWVVGWLVGFVALRPKSTAMVIAGRSVHLTTLFPGQA